MGHANPNPIIDSRQYVMEFVDSTEAELTANAISKIMYAKCDTDGNQYIMLDSIVYLRRSTTTLCNSDQNFVNNGRTYRCRSTATNQLCYQWKDISTYWKKLADLKGSHPIDTAEYEIYKNIQDEPTFNWWVPHAIKKRERII